MFVRVTKNEMINTDHIIAVNVIDHAFLTTNNCRIKVEEEYWQQFLRELTAMNVKARP